MDETQYHVLLEGRRVGPYDRRTIVGMRIKDALADHSVLIDPLGRQLTVEELMRGGRPSPAFDPGRSGTYSSVRASYEAELMSCDRSGPMPRYDGALEVRVQTAVLRIAGQLKGKDDRVKIPYADVAHVRANDRFVELWFRDGERLQAATFAFASAEQAAEFAKWIPDATPPPLEMTAAARVPIPYGIVVGVAGAVLAVVAFVVALALRR